MAEYMLVLEEIVRNYKTNLLLLRILVSLIRGRSKRKERAGANVSYSLINKRPKQVCHINRMVRLTDRACIDNLRMDRNTFGRLCRLLRDYSGLTDQRFVTVEEQVAMFLGILSHHKKTRLVGFEFMRSSYSVSRYLHIVLRAVLSLEDTLLVKPEPISDGCSDERWKCFKGCLGALDGTYINVRVRAGDTPRYRTRKGQIATNTLAVCDRFLRFIYLLPGWEGSAGDARILRDVVSRPDGLRVQKGHYYLCDNGYANSEGFLTPYKGVRYHLKEWGPACERPQNPREIFNMKHTRARNVIERAFAVLKMRWGILRSCSFYPIQVQIGLIIACFLLHNFIRGEMATDPIEELIDGQAGCIVDNEDAEDVVEYVDSVEATTAWNRMRDDLATSFWANANLCVKVVLKSNLCISVFEIYVYESLRKGLITMDLLFTFWQD